MIAAAAASSVDYCPLTRVKVTAAGMRGAIEEETLHYQLGVLVLERGKKWCWLAAAAAAVGVVVVWERLQPLLRFLWEVVCFQTF
jgi:hypothetical protein